MFTSTRRFYGGISPETAACVNCKHYIQHYIADRGLAEPSYFGHCIYPRVKNRRIYEVCEHFETKEET